MGKVRDLSGQRFGKLVAIRDTGSRNCSGNAVWLCRCDCGGLVEVASNNLMAGHTESCGCLTWNDLTGKRFGRLVAVKFTGGRRKRALEWLCKCDCGNEVEVRSDGLVSGNTRSCGCLQREVVHERLWRGGRFIKSGGYALVYMPDHPNAKGKVGMCGSTVIIISCLGGYGRCCYELSREKSW